MPRADDDTRPLGGGSHILADVRLGAVAHAREAGGTPEPGPRGRGPVRLLARIQRREEQDPQGEQQRQAEDGNVLVRYEPGGYPADRDEDRKSPQPEEL